MINKTNSARLPLGKRISAWLGDTENRSLLVPYVVFGIAAVICYLFFCYHDILLTAQHSYGYLDGRIFDYYSASHEMDGTYGSNYLPSTFILFAIWNLPLKLLGLAPAFYGDWGVIFVLWNKLLPTIFYFASACVLFKLANTRLGFGRGKSMIAALMLLTSPYAFFSQFMFCQYDSFVIFFMLLGMYYFFDEQISTKNWVLFGLFFGLATTFKYFAAVIFVVLLLLKEKNIPKILLRLVPFAAPIVLEFGFYFVFDRHAFIESVFNFGALDYAEGFVLKLGFANLNLIYLALILVCAFAYFIKPKDSFDLVGYACFLSTGVCFILFGLMTWHPQWLLFAVPFWTLSTCINRNWSVFMIIDSVAAVIFNVFVVNAFYEQTDETLFRYGILSGRLQYSDFSAYSMKDVFRFEGVDLLFTLLAVVFAVSFIFKHPRFNMRSADEPMKHAHHFVTARFACFFLSFIIPAFMCLPSFLAESQFLWGSFADGDTRTMLEVSTDKEDFIQYFSLDEGETIDYVTVMAERVNNAESEYKDKNTFENLEILTQRDETLIAVPSISVELFDAESGEVLGTSTVALDDLRGEDPTAFMLEQSVEIENGRLYGIKISATHEGTVRVACGSITLPTYHYYNVINRQSTGSKLIYRGNSAAEGTGAVVGVYGDR